MLKNEKKRVLLMSNLAVLGGKAIGKSEHPSWPIHDKLEEQMALDIVNSGIWGTGGNRQIEFEQKFSEFCGAQYGVMMTNGTHTLKLSLEALGIGPGDEVIVPGSTWQATASSVLDVNAIPVLVDITPDTYTIDPEKVEAAITSRTRCIIPVHTYGRVCDMDAILKIAKKYNLFVIEDCAHQHGSEWKGQKVGTMGNIGSFSLQALKILTTGEGGICITNDKDLYDRLYSLKFCGRATYPGSPTMQSGNFRSNEFAGGLGICQLSRLQAQNELRAENALYLEKQLSQIEGLSMLRRDERVTMQAYFHFPFQFHQEQWEDVPRKFVLKAVNAELEGSLEYRWPYEPLNNSPLYRPFSKNTHKISDEYCRAIDPSQYHLPVVERAYKSEYVGLFHPHLLSEKKELDKIVEAFEKVHKNLNEVRTLMG